MGRRKKILENLKVIDLADRGHAIGKTEDGEIILINGGVVPGDIVDVIVTKKKKGLKFGFVKEIISQSPKRVPPVCEHFGNCGGCKWQNLRYEDQAFYKENTVRETIKRIAKDDPSKVGTIRKSDQIYSYRNKLEYTFSTKRWLTREEIESNVDYANRPGLGFHVSGAFDKVVDIETCHLQENLSNEIRNFIKVFALENNFSFYDIRKNHGFLRNIIIRNSTLGHWMVTIIFGEFREKEVVKLFDVLVNQFPQVNSWNYIINPKQNSSYNDLDANQVAGKTHIEEKLGSVTYRISPKSFFQTNSRQAEVLYDTALELADLKENETLYDLYTGTGSIALYFAQKCKNVVGIEVIPEAIDDARMNASINQIENATFLVGDVKEVLHPEFSKIYGSPDIVITDPPRAGMHEDVINTLLQLEASKIVYISCNPSTQARDILLLKEKYELIKVIPVDMFPHTSHIESVALLQLI